MKLYTPSHDLKSVRPADITIAIYGLGKMGLPLAVTFASKGFHVIGADINAKVVHMINSGKNPVIGEANLDTYLKNALKRKLFIATTDLVEAAKKSDIHILLVPTYLRADNKPDLSIVQSVSEQIGRGIHRGDIVISECTLPPGTTENLITRTIEKVSQLHLNKDFGVAHCPERSSSGTAIADIMGRLNPKIIGASDKKTTAIVKWIYKHINVRGVVAVQNTQIAEMVKVAEGIYRDVNIALANTIYLQCKELGIDAHAVIEAANTDAMCHFLKPGPGVGGHCIPVYPYFILDKVTKNKQLLQQARFINDSMSEHVIELAHEALLEKGKRLQDATVLVLGIAYRGDVKETRKSPGLKIAKELAGRAHTVYVFDPLFSKDETESLGLTFYNTFDDIDCIIITANHQDYKNLNWKQIAHAMRTKVLIDTINCVDHTLLTPLDFAIRRIGYVH